MDIFFEIHAGLPREGPGDSQSTFKALSLLKELPPNPMFLDIGCGPGKQTIDLATQTQGKLIALDNHKTFLETLRHQSNLVDKNTSISLVCASMFDLPFQVHCFDCIWSEGAIYILGFEDGLEKWRRFLKPGGYLAVTEISWLKNDKPQELSSYWEKYYPGMRSLAENLLSIDNFGYLLVDHFTLPSSSWWTEYYDPIQKRIALLRGKYRDDLEAIQVINETEIEIDMYQRFSDYYGYVFYIMKKPIA